MKRLNNEQIREIQLNLLKEFDSFCKKNKIRYFATAGTLLGTIRHKGFIPWDNDIDLAVDREDYVKIQSLLNTDDESLPFRFVCYELNNDYLWQHGRIIDKKTYVKTAKNDKNFGISIDIFPLDKQGNSYKKALKNLKKCHSCVELRTMSYDKKYKEWYFPKDISLFHKLYLWLNFIFLHRQSEQYWVKKHIELAKKFNNNRESEFYGCNSNDKYCVVGNMVDYSDSILCQFENTMIPVPTGYDNILQAYFGDYMKMPPETKRIGIKEMEVYLKD